MNKQQIIDVLDVLKICIDKGHDYVFVESWPRPGNSTIITWKCKRCDYTMNTNVTEEQGRILREHRNLKPEKAK